MADSPEHDPLRVCPLCETLFRAAAPGPEGTIQHDYCPWDGNRLRSLIGWLLPGGTRVSSLVSADKICAVYRAEGASGGDDESARHTQRGERDVEVFLPPPFGGNAGGREKKAYPFDPADVEGLLEGARRLYAAAAGSAANLPVFDMPQREPWPHVTMEHVKGMTLRELLRRDDPRRDTAVSSAALRRLIGALPSEVDEKPGGSPNVSLRTVVIRAVERFDRGQGLLDPEHARPLLRGLARALGTIHAAGLTHGALVPRSVRLRWAPSSLEDRAALVLLGVAGRRLAGGARPPVEDIYGFGLIAYELLTGQSPCERPAEETGGAGAAVSRPRRMACKAPRRLRNLIMACLEPDPDKRPQTAGELVAGLG